MQTPSPAFVLDLIFFTMADSKFANGPCASLPNHRCVGKSSKGRGKGKDEEEKLIKGLKPKDNLCSLT